MEIGVEKDSPVCTPVEDFISTQRGESKG
jgi:hypothetical protein